MVTQKLSRDGIRDLFQQTGAICFDMSICQRFRYPEDFDTNKFDNWLQKSRISRGGSVDDILVNIEAAERLGGKLIFRNAGVLFFAREPHKFFEQAHVSCLLFKGTAKVHVLDRKDFDGGVVEDIEDSVRFIARNTRTAHKIDKLQCEDIPEYPMDALREAITNAIMHRDWLIEESNVSVEIFTDRIEISSPGGLAKGMQLKDLGHRSVQRNPLIADLLHRIAFIEKAGTGIMRMCDGARNQGYPEPEFTTGSFFSAVFRPMAASKVYDKVHDSVRNKVHDKVHDKIRGKVHDEVHNKVHDVVHDSVQLIGTIERRLLLECARGPQSTPDLIHALGYNVRTGNFRSALSHLMELGFLEMTIPHLPRSKNQRYRITSAGSDFIETVGENP